MLIDKFYVSDYYYLNGSTMMLKFMENPMQLEKMIDDYFSQKPVSILSTLFKIATTVYSNESKSMIMTEIKKKNAIAIENYQSTSQKSSFFKILGNSVLEAQLDQSGDRIVNKILFYMSKIPIQFSIFTLSKKFHDLLTYNRFEDYLQNCFESTDQMTNTSVLKTTVDPGIQLITSNISFLSDDFKTQFDSFGKENSLVDKLRYVLSCMCFREEKKEEIPLRQVDIKFMRVSWITTEPDLKFLTKLIEHTSTDISLFKQ